MTVNATDFEIIPKNCLLCVLDTSAYFTATRKMRAIILTKNELTWYPQLYKNDRSEKDICTFTVMWALTSKAQKLIKELFQTLTCTNDVLKQQVLVEYIFNFQ